MGDAAMKRNTVLSAAFLIVFCICGVCGCAQDTSKSPDMSALLTEYFEIRYAQLNAENFRDRIQLMEDYYTEELKAGNSWLVSSENLDSTHTVLDNSGIEAEILYTDVQYNSDNMYDATVIVKFNTEDVTSTYCTEYRFEVYCDDNMIDDIIKVDNRFLIVGEHEPVIKDGTVIGVQYECDEESCEHQH